MNAQNKILNLFVLLLLTFLSGCSKDDAYTPATPSVVVVNQDLTFGPRARIGSLTFQAASGVSVSLSSDWCTAQVSGSTVYVTVADNTGIEGRVAILTLSSGDTQLRIPVQQRGMALATLPVSNIRVDNTSSSRSYYLPHDFDVVLSTQDEWIQPVMEGDSLRIRFADNPRPSTIRRGMVEFSCAGQVDTLNVVQYDVQNTIVGTYYLGGNYGENPYGLSFELYEVDGIYYADFSSHELWDEAIFPIKVDLDRCAISIPSALDFYYAEEDYERGFFYDMAGVRAQSSDVTMTAELFSNSLLNNVPYGVLTDDGSWPGHTIRGFVIRKSYLQGLITQSLVTLTDLYLMRVGALGILDNQTEQ